MNSSNDDIFPGPDDSEQAAVGKAFADYLDLVDETIRTQVTDDDIRARIRRAIDMAASVDHQSRIQPEVPRQHGENDRGVLLDELAALMRDPRQGPAVLAGPGGTGKTTLAAALAERARARGAQVWWVSAADPVTLSRDLTATARQLAGQMMSTRSRGARRTRRTGSGGCSGMPVPGGCSFLMRPTIPGCWLPRALRPGFRT